MARRDIINFLEKGNLGKELKAALSFMLLSRGYSTDDIKVLDDYDFIIRKIESCEGTILKTESPAPKKRKQRSLPKNPVCLTSTSEVYNNRDHTLYSLNDSEPVTKGRLVWSVACLYQQSYNPTYEEVIQLFNSELNLLRNTVISESSLNALRADRQKRFYYHESDFLESSDGIRYAVSNQWSIGKMDRILSFARSKGWTVKLINTQSREDD